jgi:hypothetical protein
MYRTLGKFFIYIGAALWLIPSGSVLAQSHPENQAQDEEVQMGQEVFN